MRIRFRDQEVFVERTGRGKTVVLVHGLGTPSVWQKVLAPLAESFDLIIPHLPGFGESEPPPAPFSTADHVSLLREILDQLKIPSAGVVGISYGGQIAAVYTAAHPEKVERLGLICSSGLMKRLAAFRLASLRRMVTKFSGDALTQMAIRGSARMLYFDPGKQPPEVTGEFRRMMSDRPRRESWFQCVWNAAHPPAGFAEGLARIEVPTLILWGRNDRVIPARFAQAFQERIRNSRSEMLEECGHALPLEQPEHTVRLLRDFFA